MLIWSCSYFLIILYIIKVVFEWKLVDILLRSHCCKPLILHLVQLHQFRLFQCPSFEKVLHSSCHWSLRFSISYPALNAAITSLQISPYSSLQIISSFCGIVNVWCFCLPTVPCLLILGPFVAIVIAWCSQYGPHNPRYNHGISTCTRSYDGGNFGLGNTFLKCSTIRIANKKALHYWNSTVCDINKRC